MKVLVSYQMKLASRLSADSVGAVLAVQWTFCWLYRVIRLERPTSGKEVATTGFKASHVRLSTEKPPYLHSFELHKTLSDDSRGRNEFGFHIETFSIEFRIRDFKVLVKSS